MTGGPTTKRVQSGGKGKGKKVEPTGQSHEEEGQDENNAGSNDSNVDDDDNNDEDGMEVDAEPEGKRPNTRKGRSKLKSKKAAELSAETIGEEERDRLRVSPSRNIPGDLIMLHRK